LRLAIDDHDLADFMDDLVSELGPLPAGITLTVDPAAAEQIDAWAFDAYLVKLALLDALRNALRHARTHVMLGLQAEPAGGICFTVADDGPGFPELVLSGAATQSGSEGTGLGISFARLIAERHATPAGRHGRVELANHSGAILRIHLP
jgi:signal transduction histidine kinase